MTVNIIGAGMAGLLAARMLQDLSPRIFERQPGLPNNHAAVLRFRSLDVSAATGIPFRKVRVLKAISPSLGNPVADALGYSLKVTGRIQPRSIINVDPVDRYIAPPDFIERMARGLNINYDFNAFDATELYGARLIPPAEGDNPIISTIPMPLLMKALSYTPHEDFSLESHEGWTIRGTIPPKLHPSAYATIYNPGYHDPWYRASITGSSVMIEGVGPTVDVNVQLEAGEALNAFGIRPACYGWRDWDWEIHSAKYQKISEPSPEIREEAKRFILWASAEHNIFSLGRFATWRPGLLLDDVVNDVWIIRRLIEGGSHYDSVKGG